MTAHRHLSFLHHASAKWGCLCGSLLPMVSARFLEDVTCPECLVAADQISVLDGLEVLSIGTRIRPNVFPTAPPPPEREWWQQDNIAFVFPD